MTARMRTMIKLMLAIILMAPAVSHSAEKDLTVKSARFFSYAAFTRIVFEVETAAPYVITKTDNGRTLVFAAYDAAVIVKTPLPQVRDGVVNGIAEKKDEQGRTAIVIRLDAGTGDVKDFVLRAPDRIVVDIAKGAAPPVAPKIGSQVVIVLDPGHGGGDAGVETPQGPEKNITLALAQTIKALLQRDPRVQVVLTRDKDQALTQNERAAIANSADAALFVSIHAAAGPSARVYIQEPDEYADARSVQPAGRDFLSFEAGSERQVLLWGTQQAAHTRESGALGRLLARGLDGGSGAEPVQAPLAGFRAIDAAAVMIEFGSGQDRVRVAEAVARGIEQYAGENR